MDFFGAETEEQFVEAISGQVYDSVQDYFYTECGYYFGEGEPDLRGITCPECGKPAVEALEEILISGL